MQCKLKDETGNRYGKLTVIERHYYEGKNNGAKWMCECDCGNNHIVAGGQLRNGTTTSCGCVYKKNKEEMYKRIKEENKTTYNILKNCGMGITAKGDVFIFDIEDYNKIKEYNWRKTKNEYFVGTKRVNILLQRLIMNEPYGLVVDHMNHNRWDNRKSNLRVCTYKENNQNKRKLDSNTSGVTGVYFNKKDKKWSAQIGIDNNILSLGLYENKEGAIKARKEAEEKYFGEFSYSNSIVL